MFSNIHYNTCRFWLEILINIYIYIYIYIYTYSGINETVVGTTSFMSSQSSSQVITVNSQ